VQSIIIGNRDRALIQVSRQTEKSLMAEDCILETAGLVKEFRGFVAVNGVDLKVRRGHIHALIGPNGAGKTTCFNLLTKFLEPTRGEIRFNGIDITREAPEKIARRGIVRSFQISAVFPHLTVLENVRIACSASSEPAFISGSPTAAWTRSTTGPWNC
jgi:branched-chain amino acid transport system ATP-binding protein